MSMESQTMNHASSARKRPTKNEKLLLQDFIHFLHTRQSLHLTMNQLNQIIRIHGFKKLHRAPKKVLMDAVDSLNLVEIQRSTLRQKVSAFAVLTVEDVVADLADLNWQECCVTSIEKLSSNNNNNNENLSNFSSDQHSLQLANHSQSQPEKQLSLKKTRRIEEIYGDVLMPEQRASTEDSAEAQEEQQR